jgi:hypothetical protein
VVSLGWVYQDSPLRKVQPAMSGTHLTPAERERLFELKMAQHSNAEIARRMGRHRSNIGRELKRFESHESWPACGRYFPDYAQGMGGKAVGRSSLCRRPAGQDAALHHRFTGAVVGTSTLPPCTNILHAPTKHLPHVSHPSPTGPTMTLG